MGVERSTACPGHHVHLASRTRWAKGLGPSAAALAAPLIQAGRPESPTAWDSRTTAWVRFYLLCVAWKICQSLRCHHQPLPGSAGRSTSSPALVTLPGKDRSIPWTGATTFWLVPGFLRTGSGGPGAPTTPFTTPQKGDCSGRRQPPAAGHKTTNSLPWPGTLGHWFGPLAPERRAANRGTICQGAMAPAGKPLGVDVLGSSACECLVSPVPRGPWSSRWVPSPGCPSAAAKASLEQRSPLGTCSVEAPSRMSISTFATCLRPGRLGRRRRAQNWLVI